MVPHRQPRQRGLRRDDGVPVPAARATASDGRSVGFMYKRPTIANNDAFDAGGLKWTMVTPFEELRIDYTGKVVLLDEPEQMAEPEGSVHQQPLRRVRGAHHVHRPGRAQHVRRRARHAARDTGRGVRQGPLRAARAGARHHPRRRPRVGDPRPRPARPLVGPALLAGAVVLPLAHRQRERGLRLHGQPRREEGRPGHPRRLRVGERPDALLRRRRRSAPTPAATSSTTTASRACCVRRARTGSGRSPAR